jgi:hypothetical protein
MTTKNTNWIGATGNNGYDFLFFTSLSLRALKFATIKMKKELNQFRFLWFYFVINNN